MGVSSPNPSAKNAADARRSYAATMAWLIYTVKGTSCPLADKA
ncbi:MAG: hypothetical protein AVDCRST_MAG93-325 [uncultured Chloroflexia bacterium]|uniref:Uncharacterized protein n=1 Tax=uncultured Chloroflexia bacterium TaxID=1672391 RepID=A0A6J4HAM0_9CHLR|nr:MAG: hypothetical protein AVDCRST_MAG93-325 [uncultured Chloroflexia bacterium]